MTTTQIIEAPQDQVVHEGEAACFSCRVHGVPPPHVAWFFDGDPISDSEIYRFDSRPDEGRHTLHIPEAFPEDGGVYTVRVQNEHGSCEASATLTVEGECVIPACHDNIPTS